MKKYHTSMIPDGYTLIEHSNAIKFNLHEPGRYSGGIWVIAKNEYSNEFIKINNKSPYFIIIQWINQNLIVCGS